MLAKSRMKELGAGRRCAPAVREKALSLTRDAKSDLERMKAVYGLWLRKSTLSICRSAPLDSVHGLR